LFEQTSVFCTSEIAKSLIIPTARRLPSRPVALVAFEDSFQVMPIGGRVQEVVLACFCIEKQHIVLNLPISRARMSIWLILEFGVEVL
jgi:hypothetical protein